jgi:hypothetical protein
LGLPRDRNFNYASSRLIITEQTGFLPTSSLQTREHVCWMISLSASSSASPGPLRPGELAADLRLERTPAA